MEKHTIWNFGRQFAREPILRPMADGSLICLFLTGGPTEPHNENVDGLPQLRRRRDVDGACNAVLALARACLVDGAVLRLREIRLQAIRSRSCRPTTPSALPRAADVPLVHP